MQPSLVQRLRDSVTQCRALDRSQLLEEAAAEIERLNGEVVLWQAVASLNAQEREAVERAVDVMDAIGIKRQAMWLRGLLERFS